MSGSSGACGLEVHVGVTVVVAVRMRVCRAVRMGVFVNVRAGPPGLPQSPREVREAETREQPRGGIATHALDPLEAVERQADGDAGGADHHRPKHVAEAADAGDPERASRRPAAGTRHRDERQVVVRPEQCVDEADRRRGGEQQREVDAHGRPVPCV
jgi:hypothetical protein